MSKEPSNKKGKTAHEEELEREAPSFENLYPDAKEELMLRLSLTDLFILQNVSRNLKQFIY